MKRIAMVTGAGRGLGRALCALLSPDEAAVAALAYFVRDLHSDVRDPAHSDEDRLVMRDWRGREWPW